MNSAETYTTLSRAIIVSWCTDTQLSSSTEQRWQETGTIWQTDTAQAAWISANRLLDYCNTPHTITSAAADNETTFCRHLNLIFSTQPLPLPSDPSHRLRFFHDHGALYIYLLTYLLTYLLANSAKDDRPRPTGFIDIRQIQSPVLRRFFGPAILTVASFGIKFYGIITQLLICRSLVEVSRRHFKT